MTVSYEKFENAMREKQVIPADVAKATGMYQSVLSDWKNGISIPKMDKLIKLADYFGVSLDYFVEREDKA